MVLVPSQWNMASISSANDVKIKIGWGACVIKTAGASK